MVYFMVKKGDPNSPIKIGYSDATNIKDRLIAHQVSTPDELEYLGVTTGDELFERLLHQKFQDYRLRGEWFSPAPEILKYVREHCTSFEEHEARATKNLVRVYQQKIRELESRIIDLEQENERLTKDSLNLRLGLVE